MAKQVSRSSKRPPSGAPASVRVRGEIAGTAVTGEASPPGSETAGGGGSDPRAGARAKRSADRKAAILAAALQEFSASGFASTRLDDVAKRAGVAKGTIYLHFADKEALFEELIRSELNPVIEALERASQADVPIETIVGGLVDLFVSQIYETRRKDVLRLVLTEGPRFPQLSEFYYREVIARLLAAMRGMLRRAMDRGEISGDALERFPQLIVAPGIVAIFWNGLFERFEPLDVRALMRAHLDLIFDSVGRTR